MEHRLTFLTIGVTDMEQSICFYEDKLGWKRASVSTDDLIVYHLQGFLFALYPYEALMQDAGIDIKGTGFKGFTLSYNLESENDVDELIRELKKKQVPVIKEPQKVFWGGYHAYIADPDNNIIEIAYNPFLNLKDI